MATNNVLKTAGSITGAAVLMGSALMLTPVSALALNEDAQAPQQEAAITADETTRTTSQTVTVSEVQGTFGFNQTVCSTVKDFTSVFNKAAATLCEGLPVYDAEAASGSIEVTNVAANTVLSTSVDELAQQDDVTNMIIGCACSSNVAGGGAIANADISGVALSALASLVSAI